MKTRGTRKWRSITKFNKVHLNFKRNTYCVTTPEEGLKLGFFSRIRGIATQVVLGLVLMSTPPMWFPVLTGIAVSAPIAISISLILLVVVLLCLVASVRSRRRYIALQRAEIAMSDFLTFCRIFVQNEDAVSEAARNEWSFSLFCNRLANEVAATFQGIRASESIACCIRMSSPVESGVYKTVGRSSQLSDKRSQTTRPVTNQSGVYRLLTENIAGRSPVWVIPDVCQAVADGAISRDLNIDAYGDEIRSMIVARIDSYESGDNEGDALLGMLYVTSPNTGEFNSVDAWYLQSVSEAIAIVVKHVSQRREASGLASVVNGKVSGNGKKNTHKSKARKRSNAHHSHKGRKGKDRNR